MNLTILLPMFVREIRAFSGFGNEDSGISDATNFAISHARGDIIGYLGSDDILLKDVFAESRGIV